MESQKLDEAPDYEEKKASPRASDLDDAEGEVFDNADNLQRRLGNRQIQLIAIGGSIGTALFVSINSGLYHGGPGSLLIAYFLYSCMLGLVNNCVAEMSTYMPVSGGFIRLAGTRNSHLKDYKSKLIVRPGHWVDEAFGFMAGWNFFFYEALLIPFEITALNTVLKYWVNISQNYQMNLADNIPSVMTFQLLLFVLLASYYTRT